MNNNELFEIHKFICNEALELTRKKNHDYSGKSGKEPFANFTRAEAMGITTTEKGMMVRLLDKISRLSTFCDSGEFKVEDEKLKDTIIDSINYCILLYAYIQSKNDIRNPERDILLIQPELAQKIRNANPELDIVDIDISSQRSTTDATDEDAPEFWRKSQTLPRGYPF